MMSNRDINVYKEMLAYINPASLNYQDWVNVGMALKHEGCPLEWWDEWSAQEPRYKVGECFQKWKTFEGNGVTGGTLQYLAELNGWTPSFDGKRYKISGTGINADGSLEFDAIIHMEEDDSVIDKSWVEEESFREPRTEEWKPIDELITYLETLFDPSDYVGYVMQSRLVGEGEKEKFIPYNSGVFHKTAGELIGDLRKYHDIGKALGDYDALGGAWIRFNPLDGQGIKNANVTYFRYALVECDNMSLGMQVSLMKELKLPIAALVYSGSKSIHAIVKIDAVTYEDYQKKVKYLYDVCQKNGITIDTQNKNPSRLSRMPGVIRGKHKQFLLETNIGFSTFEEWKEWVESVNDDLPEPIVLADYWDNRPEQDPEIIQDILRQGRKMLIGGQSKIGKTNLVMELALSIANGWHWIGKLCTKGKILYLNYELPEATFNERLQLICERKGYDVKEVTQNFHVLHLRNYFFDNVDKHVKNIANKFKKEKYSALFIDPLYKLGDGEDENNAGAMAKLCNRFGVIASGMGCAVIVVHHFAKGDSSKKQSMDRFSGSGVFARDADALLTLNALEVKDGNKKAARIEMTLREYAEPEPINVWFDFPTFTVDDYGDLKGAKLKGTTGTKSHDDNLKEWVSKLHLAFDILTQDQDEKIIPQPTLMKWMYDIGADSGLNLTTAQRTAFINNFKEAQIKGLTYLRKDSSKNKRKGEPAYVYIDLDVYEELLDEE